MPETEYINSASLETYRYNGRDYRIPGYDQTGVRQEIDKSFLPPRLYRVFEPGIAKFDANGVLMPINRSATNDMVSLAAEGDWEKFARVQFFTAKELKVFTIATADLVGPVFAVGNAFFDHPEILALVPGSAIEEVRTFTWEAVSGERHLPSFQHSFPLVDKALLGSYGDDLYHRLTAQTKGWELQLLKTQKIDQP